MTATPLLVTVPLDEPIVRGEQRIESVQVRRPGPGELRGLAMRSIVNSDVDTMHILLTRVTVPPITEPELEAMALPDFLECCNQVAGFLPQRGGATASRTP